MPHSALALFIFFSSFQLFKYVSKDTRTGNFKSRIFSIVFQAFNEIFHAISFTKIGRRLFDKVGALRIPLGNTNKPLGVIMLLSGLM